MTRILVLLTVLFAINAAQAQSLNDLILLWVAQSGKTAARGDWATCQPDGQADGICTWNTTNLGAQPTSQQLQALVSVWTNQQKATQFDAVVTAGVAVTGNSGLAGSYYADETAQGKLSGVITGISAGQGLPGGGTTFFYLDMRSAPHSFTADQITALGKCVRDFIYGATITRATLQAGQAADWPTNICPIP